MGIVDNLMTHPATIVRKGRTGGLDEHGVPMLAESSGFSTVCYLDQAGQTGSERGEVTTGREAELETYIGYFPAAVNLDGTDMVTVDGLEFEVIGPPWYARDPVTDTVDHTELTLRRITG